MKYQSISEVYADIQKMNAMYKLPIKSAPSLDFEGQTTLQRFDGFVKTLQKEMDEAPDVRGFMAKYEATEGSDRDAARIEALTHLSDWFADIMVYVMSESLKFGIPVFDIFNMVMQSNFTKLGADGKPIYDENGKFLKGPNFVPPEAMISAFYKKLEDAQ